MKETLREALFNFNKNCQFRLIRAFTKFVAGQTKGKAGGYRVYVYIVEIKNILTPIAIYAKNESKNLSLNEMCTHLNNVKEELSELLKQSQS